MKALTMRNSKTKKGITLVEILVVIAIIGMLVGVMIGVSGQMDAKGKERLTKSSIQVIVAALEQFYDDEGEFPFIADPIIPWPYYTLVMLETDLGGPVSGANDDDEWYTSEALYFFLNKNPNSRKLIGAIDQSLLNNKGSNGTDLTYSVSGGQPIPLIRFIDGWGNSLQYTYANGDNFPLIESAGPDGDLNTAGDNITSDDL